MSSGLISISVVDIRIGPSAIGLLTPWLLVGGGAALGGLPARPVWRESATVRAGVAGVYGVVTDTAVLAALGLLIALVMAAINPPPINSTSAPAALGVAVLAVGYAPPERGDEPVGEDGAAAGVEQEVATTLRGEPERPGGTDSRPLTPAHKKRTPPPAGCALRA